MIIAMQIVNLTFAQMHNKRISAMQIVTAVIFLIPAVLYFLKLFSEAMPIVIGVMLIIESLYALH